MWRRILAIFDARNREFYRDKAGLGWNIVMPFLFVLAFAFIFKAEPEPLFKVGVLTDDLAAARAASPFLALEHLEFVPLPDLASAVAKVERHQIDLLFAPGTTEGTAGAGGARYWINEHSQKGYLAARVLASAYGPAGKMPERQTVSGRALRYVDWVLPGVLAMNVMFSSLWGVGWVIVRYRKNGVLRRLKATPLSAFEFLAAQVLSRLAVVMSASIAVFVAADLLLDFVMRGSYVTLLLVYLSGSLCLISVGLLVAARIRTEELADGVLNLISWPMMLLSGVWFSLEGASPAAQLASRFLPLTYLVDAARRVMVEGAGLVQVWPEVAILTAISLLLLGLAARLFRWN